LEKSLENRKRVIGVKKLLKREMMRGRNKKENIDID